MESEELSKLIERYRLAYEFAPAQRLVDSERRSIGFDLTLCAACAHEGAEPLPGDRSVQGIWDDLNRIAAAIQPSDTDIQYRIEPFDHALHQAPARQFREDVELVIEVRHKEGYFDPIDGAERRAIEKMQTELIRLGAKEHSHD